MSQQKKPSWKLVPADFVEKVSPENPKNDNVVMFVGFLGVTPGAPVNIAGGGAAGGGAAGGGAAGGGAREKYKDYVSVERWRLYFTPQLDEWIEFDRSDIADFKDLKTTSNPLGGTILWLYSSAKVTLVRSSDVQATRAESLRQQSAFFQGGIVGNFGPQPNFGVPQGWNGWPTWLYGWQQGPFVGGASGGGCSTLPACSTAVSCKY